MKHLVNVSAQNVSWVKSNKNRLESIEGIENLYYPESVDELVGLIREIRSRNEEFDVIGYSSNTLFLPSYRIKHLICTKHINHFEEEDHFIYCDCGVSVSSISKYAVKEGYEGYDGLCDLPGTIASGVYGNCGCFGCSVLGVVHSFTLLTDDNSIKEFTVNNLKPSFRSTALKRGELGGIILRVKLLKLKGNKQQIIEKAERAHKLRAKNQPTGANNLGSTFNGGNKVTLKGFFFKSILWILLKVSNKPQRDCLPYVLSLFGKSKFSPYLWNFGRWMYYDEKSHDLFFEYYDFLKSLFKDIRLEIEINE